MKNNGDNKKNGLLDEAKTINSSLNKVKQSITLGVIQTESAASTLDQDTETLSSSLHEHKYNLKNALDSTNRRLQRIKNAEIREKYFTIFSITFFSLVVAYIVLKRTRVFLFVWNLTC